MPLLATITAGPSLRHSSSRWAVVSIGVNVFAEKERIVARRLDRLLRQLVRKGGVGPAHRAHHAIRVDGHIQLIAEGQQNLQDFLRASQRKRRDQRLTALLRDLAQRIDQPFFFRDTVGVQFPAIRAFQDQRIGFDIRQRRADRRPAARSATGRRT